METNAHRWVDDPASPEGRLLRELQLSVTPPSATRERLWARLAARRLAARPMPPTRLFVPAAAAVTLALVVAAVSLWPAGEVGRIGVLDGTASLTGKDGNPHPARASDGLRRGQRLVVDAGGRALVAAPSLRLVATPRTALTVGTLDGGNALTIERGQVLIDVQPRKGADDSVKVTVGAFTVVVVGTLFAVELEPPTTVRVRVFHGTVRVEGAGSARFVRAGETFASSGQEREARAPMTSATQLAAAARLLGFPDLLEEEGEETAAAGAPTSAVGGGAGVISMPATTATSGSSNSLAPTTGTHGRRSVGAPGAAAPPRAGGSTSPADSQEATGSAADGTDHGNSTAAPEEEGAAQARLYEQAMRTSDVGAAVALLDEAAREPGSYAELAAYRAAQLVASHDVADAERRLRAFLAWRPRSPLAPEAKLWLIERTVRSGRLEEARGEIAGFLAAYPESERAAEVRFVRAEIVRTRQHDCVAALPDYAQAAVAGRRAEEALYWLAWCLEATGRGDEARARFTEYLTRYPEGRYAQAARQALP